MPRASYEQHRATRIGLRRRGSFAESETDASSVYSATTHQSSSSYSPSLSTAPQRQHSYTAPLPHAVPGTGATGTAHRPSPLRSLSPPASPDSSVSALASPSRSRSLLAPPQFPRQSSSASASSSFIGSSGSTPIDRAARHARRDERRRLRAEKSTLSGGRYDSPLRRWVRWMGQQGLGGRSLLGVGLVGVGVVKTAIGYGGFSGKDTPPMFGDFEAQRHWMSVTINRKIQEWYFAEEDWWLLDYPPVTAYVSWACGKIGSFLNPSWFAPISSRGLSPPELVTFMRFSVLVLEAAVYWSAVVAWAVHQGRQGGRSWRTQVSGIMTVLLMPGLALIDSGHFQYNSVLLGLSLWAFVAFSKGQDTLGCVFFCGALSFKQMGLYYAPAVGIYLLGKCIWLDGMEGAQHLATLGVATLSTFALIFLPFLAPARLAQVVHRMFPFARGIFEDKVANFWCASNVVLKWRNYVSIPGMAKLAAVATFVSLIPTVHILLKTSITLQRSSQSAVKDHLDGRRHSVGSHPVERVRVPPTSQLLLLAAFTGSLSFFLFSFQVHEKSILLPLMPLTLMMALREESEEEVWEIGVLVNNVAVFSMWPLLKRDGQALQVACVTALWNYVIGYSPASVSSQRVRWLGYLVYSAMAMLLLPDIAPGLILPPARYPDLWIVLNVLLSAAVFGLAWIWGNLRLVQASWALEEWSMDKISSTKPTKEEKKAR